LLTHTPGVTIHGNLVLLTVSPTVWDAQDDRLTSCFSTGNASLTIGTFF